MPYTDPKKRREMTERWERNNPDKVAAIRQRVGARNKAKRRDGTFHYFGRVRGARLYDRGAPPKASRPMPKSCECCGAPPADGKSLCFDHCHESNKFRGWLCSKCNTGIGMLGDTLAAVQCAVAYLQRAETCGTEPEKS